MDPEQLAKYLQEKTIGSQHIKGDNTHVEHEKWDSMGLATPTSPLESIHRTQRDRHSSSLSISDKRDREEQQNKQLKKEKFAEQMKYYQSILSPIEYQKLLRGIQQYRTGHIQKDQFHTIKDDILNKYKTPPSQISVSQEGAKATPVSSRQTQTHMQKADNTRVGHQAKDPERKVTPLDSMGPKQYYESLDDTLKAKLRMYQSAPKENRKAIIDKTPELIPVLKTMVAYKENQSNRVTKPMTPKQIDTSKIKIDTINRSKSENVPVSIKPPTNRQSGFKNTKSVSGYKNDKPNINTNSPQCPPQFSSQITTSNNTMTRKNPMVNQERRRVYGPKKDQKQNINIDLWTSDIEAMNDVTRIAGVDLEKEETQDDFGDTHECDTLNRKLTKAPLFLNVHPLKNKIALKLRIFGLDSADHDILECISLATECRMRNYIESLINVSNHRMEIPEHKSNIVNNEKELYQTMEGVRDKVTQTKSKMSGSKRKRKGDESKSRDLSIDETQRQIDTISILADFSNNKKRKFNFMSSPTKHSGGSDATSKKNVNDPLHSPNILMRDVLHCMEKDPSLKKTNLMFSVYSKITQ